VPVVDGVSTQHLSNTHEGIRNHLEVRLNLLQKARKLKAVLSKIPGLNPVSGFVSCHAINESNSKLIGIQHNGKA